MRGSDELYHRFAQRLSDGTPRSCSTLPPKGPSARFPCRPTPREIGICVRDAAGTRTVPPPLGEFSYAAVVLFNAGRRIKFGSSATQTAPATSSCGRNCADTKR